MGSKLIFDLRKERKQIKKVRKTAPILLWQAAVYTSLFIHFLFYK
jgi:hypothetical protein